MIVFLCITGWLCFGAAFGILTMHVQNTRLNKKYPKQTQTLSEYMKDDFSLNVGLLLMITFFWPLALDFIKPEYD